MSTSYVWVRPATEANRVKVLTEKVGEVEIPVYALIDETGSKLAYVDPNSGAVGTLDHEHMQVHLGHHYTVVHAATIDDSGGATPTLDFSLINPASNYPHLRSMHVQSDGGPFNIDLYEGSTFSANGTALTANNNNRNSSNIADLAVSYGATTTADGTLLESILVPGTRGVTGSDVVEEWILQPSTNYMIRITNNTAGAGSSQFRCILGWYES